MAYWINNCSDKVSVTENLYYLNEAITNVPKYTHIFLLVPEFPIINDNYRDTDIMYQHDIDIIIKCILCMCNIKHHKITGNTKDRFNKAMEIIKQ